MPSPAPFSETWTLSDTQQHLNRPEFPEAGTQAEQIAWELEVASPANKKLAAAIGRHIAWKMQSGVSVVPLFCENVSVYIIDALKNLQANQEDEKAQIEAGDHFVQQMQIGMCFFSAKSTTLVASEVHEKLMGIMEKGKFRFSPADNGPCALSGLRLYVLFQDWRSVAATMQIAPGEVGSRPTFQYAAVTKGQIPAQGVAETVTLPMPTGELLIADWFRIEAFHTLTSPIDHDNDHDISSVGGRATRTRRYAKELGIGHVACRSPDILQDEGVVKVGYLDVEAPSYPANYKGRISADLRWTTLVDRGHLVDLLTPALGEDEAERQVAEHLQQNTDIIKLQVEPGTHHLTFAGTSGFFKKTINERFQAQGLHLEDFDEPAFVLTREPLTSTLSQEPTQDQAPDRKSPRP